MGYWCQQYNAESTWIETEDTVDSCMCDPGDYHSPPELMRECLHDGEPGFAAACRSKRRKDVVLVEFYWPDGTTRYAFLKWEPGCTDEIRACWRATSPNGRDVIVTTWIYKIIGVDPQTVILKTKMDSSAMMTYTIKQIAESVLPPEGLSWMRRTPPAIPF